MLKKIVFTGILLISISVLKAKNITPLSNFASIITTIDEGLVNKLVADNDFKNYYISNVRFANKIIETKAGLLFQKYLQNNITPVERAELLAKMNVNTKNEFDAIAVNLQTEAIAFMNKFAELKQLPKKEQKELIINAFKKLNADKSITTTFVKAKNPSALECFWYWVTCGTACFIGCNGDQTCLWECEGFCAALYGLCWLWVD